MEGDRGLDAFYDIIIILRHCIAGICSRVYPYTRAARGAVCSYKSGRWCKFLGVLCINPALYTVPPYTYVLLRIGYFLSVGYPYLLSDKVYACHHLCDRMLHLYSCIHFHEIEIKLVIYEKLYRSGAYVIYIFDRLYCRFAHLLPHLLINYRRWRLFNKLLVSSLNRAVSFSKIYGIA